MHITYSITICYCFVDIYIYDILMALDIEWFTMGKNCGRNSVKWIDLFPRIWSTRFIRRKSYKVKKMAMVELSTQMKSQMRWPSNFLVKCENVDAEISTLPVIEKIDHSNIVWYKRDSILSEHAFALWLSGWRWNFRIEIKLISVTFTLEFRPFWNWIEWI